MSESYDIVAVGTGFASSFFLHRYLERSSRPLRILILEAGPMKTHKDQLTEGDPMEVGIRRQARADAQFVNASPEKTWRFYTGFGGGSNCWVACTPRLVPEDFELYSKYGIGMDWPLSYDELEPYYCQAEEMMQVGGDSDRSPVPRSKPFPQKAHRFSEPDKLLKEAYPEHIFCHPAARTPGPVPNQRGACCNSGVCQLCPVDAKFTILNGMKALYDNKSIELRCDCKVLSVEHSGNVATGVTYRDKTGDKKVKADMVVLGANAMFNPHIMLNSGMDHPQLGVGLCEQVSRSAFIRLDGVNNFTGGTVSNALGYHMYAGEHRKQRAAALMQSINQPSLLNVRGKWQQMLRVNFIYEDFRLQDNHVTVSSENPELPVATHARRSELTDKGLNAIDKDLEPILAALPSIDYRLEDPWRTDSHIMGTTVMGNDPKTSIADRDCLHHELRNLVVLGSGNFPTAAPANPTLTISALSLWSADRLTA
jgi:choline dehydrogenase-like flavoprotein